jgi:hypothetical protein
MRHREPEKIALPLGDLRNLFTAPEFDPFEGRTGADPVAADAFEDELYEPGRAGRGAAAGGRGQARRAGSAGRGAAAAALAVLILARSTSAPMNP